MHRSKGAFVVRIRLGFRFWRELGFQRFVNSKDRWKSSAKVKATEKVWRVQEERNWFK